MACRFAIWARLGRLRRQNASNDKPVLRLQSKSADCSLRLPRIMLKETSYDGDTWPNPRHKLHRQAFRWPALRAVGELPRSNRIRSKDQIKPMLFWRLGLAHVFRRAHQAREEAMQRGRVAVGRQQSCCGPDTVVAPCKFMACCRPGKGFVRNNLPFGPHTTTYGAAWLRRLPSRGTISVGCVLVWIVGKSTTAVSFHRIIHPPPT
jgi:hypothetical protein